MLRVRVCLAGGLTLTAAAVFHTLLGSPLVVARANEHPIQEDRLVRTDEGGVYCQAHELLPRGTSAVRLSLGADYGPQVRMVISSGGRLIATGTRGSGWEGRVVTIVVRPLRQIKPDVTVCASFHLTNSRLIVFGQPSSQALATRAGGRALPGRMLIEYLHTGSTSWASLASSIATHMGFGRSPSGTWIAWLVLALSATVVALSSALVLKALQ